MKEINIILGQNIRARRSALMISREKLAEKIDVSPRFLADVESGKVGVSIETLKLLATNLSCSTDFLLGMQTTSVSESKILVEEIALLDSKYYSALTTMIKELQKISK